MEYIVRFDRHNDQDIEVAEHNFPGVALQTALKGQFLAELRENKELPEFDVIHELYTDARYWFLVTFRTPGVDDDTDNIVKEIQRCYDEFGMSGFFEVLGTMPAEHHDFEWLLRRIHGGRYDGPLGMLRFKLHVLSAYSNDDKTLLHNVVLDRLLAKHNDLDQQAQLEEVLGEFVKGL